MSAQVRVRFQVRLFWQVSVQFLFLRQLCRSLQKYNKEKTN